MKIAYIILAHKNPDQIKRLVLRLNTEGTSFFIHIDKKSNNKIYENIVDDLSPLSNVYFLKRFKIFWGDFSIVKATIEGIKEIFKTNTSFDWLILLSGQDYPLKSNSKIQETLLLNEGKLFISHCNYPIKPGANEAITDTERIDYYHFNICNMRLVFPGKLAANTANKYRLKKYILLRLFSFMWSCFVFLFPIKRKFIEGFTPYIGSQFWCLPKESVEYIHKFIQQNSAFVNFFNYVDIADEIFFQTILLNSKFKERVVNNNLFYIDWENPNPRYPRVFIKSDFEKLVSSSTSKLFARKFDMTRDTNILDMIDQKILNDPG